MLAGADATNSSHVGADSRTPRGTLVRVYASSLSVWVGVSRTHYDKDGAVLDAFKIFFTASLEVVLVRFSKDAVIPRNLGSFRGGRSGVKDRDLACARGHPRRECFIAEAAGFVPRSPTGLARMMAVIVTVLHELGLCVSENKMNDLVCHVPRVKTDNRNTTTTTAHAYGRRSDLLGVRTNWPVWIPRGVGFWR